MRTCHVCGWEQSEEIIEDNDYIILSHYCLDGTEVETKILSHGTHN
jgi:hypothetical protein